MDSVAERIRFVVGLGNPGRRYAATRHNVGWMVLEALRRRWALGEGRLAFGGELWDARVELAGGLRRVMLFQPHTYMNCSGQAVKGLLAFYKAAPADLLVVMDDLALPVGRLRLRAEGSHGGHNGLKDVLRHLGSEAVGRLRLGIGEPPAEMDAADYVLSRLDDDDRQRLRPAIERAADAAQEWCADEDIHRLMEKYNRLAEDL